LFTTETQRERKVYQNATSANDEGSVDAIRPMNSRCVCGDNKMSLRSQNPYSVILSGVADSRSESATQSKDPYFSQRHGDIPKPPLFMVSGYHKAAVSEKAIL